MGNNMDSPRLIPPLRVPHWVPIWNWNPPSPSWALSFLFVVSVKIGAGDMVKVVQASFDLYRRDRGDIRGTIQ